MGGIALSLYAGWLTVDDIRDRASSERAISKACDRLVSGAEVMKLHGGTVRAEAGDYDTLDVRELPSVCTIYKVKDSGRTASLFKLWVESSNDTEPLNLIGADAGREPFGGMLAGSHYKPDITAVADRRPEERPLGDGTLGWYENWYITVRAECGPGSGAKAPKLLNVTARADYQDVSTADRERLARIARSAAEQVAARIGCKTHLPALPDRQLTPVPSTLRPAKAADESCAWFAAHLKEQGQGRLPDRFLAVPISDVNPIESCLLAVSPDQVRRIGKGLNGDDAVLVHGGLTYSPWWLRTASYFGPEAGTVGYHGPSGQEDVIEAGTAGRTYGGWWASSICDGKPAVHTLSANYAYDNVVGSQALYNLFRAYVDDITKRHGCTHVTYPDRKDFSFE
ncbi:hypothetical protein ACWDSD_28410 [Streptomyces spiralis]